jgi:hypothetical protein
MMDRAVIAEFCRIVGENRVVAAPEALKVYGYGGTTNRFQKPDLVAFPMSSNSAMNSGKIWD